MTRTLGVLILLALAILTGQAQPSTLRFPLTASDSGAFTKTFTLYLCLHPLASICLDTIVFTGFELCGVADTTHVQEIEAPPMPPDAQFRFSPYNSALCAINLWRDDVRHSGDTTDIDTFKVVLKTEPDFVDIHAVTYTWPACIADAADSIILQQRLGNPPGAFRINMALESSFTLHVSTGGINAMATLYAFIIIKGPRPNKVVAVDDRFFPLPTSFGLGQNYPNPFNPVTTITYSLPKAAHVRLKIYNMLGEEVASLVDEVKEPGPRSVEFDGTTLTSGMYFYRMTAGRFAEVKKMMLVK